MQWVSWVGVFGAMGKISVYYTTVNANLGLAFHTWWLGGQQGSLRKTAKLQELQNCR